MKKRAALYIRVSTMEQAKEGYSIPAQTGKLKSFATAKDMAVYKIYTDPGFSGAKMERPGLQQMLTDIDAGKIDVVLVYKLDRLSRSQKNTLFLIEDIFMAKDVDFISMQESFDTSTPFGRATIGMLSVFAQLERDTITERMSMGRTERAKQGYYHGSGVSPIGYDYIEGNLIINEYEAVIIREIFDMYVNQNKGQNNISTTLANKYPDKIQTRTMVKYVLTNPIYIGKISWDGQVYNGKHTPIISDELFAKADAKVKNQSSLGGKQHCKQVSLLTGIIYCGNCGAKMFREAGGGGSYKGKSYNYSYYTCHSVKKNVPSLIKDPNCQQKRLRCERVEDDTIKVIQEFNFAEALYKNKYQQKDNTHEEELLQSQLNKKQTEKNKIIDLYQFGNIDIESLNKRIAKINVEIDQISININSLHNSSNVEQTIEIINEVSDFSWNDSSTADKIRVIRSFIDRITITDSDISVNFKF